MFEFVPTAQSYYCRARKLINVKPYIHCYNIMYKRYLCTTKYKVYYLNATNYTHHGYILYYRGRYRYVI